MNISNSQWIILKDKLERLFLASFGKPIQQGYLDWRYINNDKEHLLFSIDIFNQEPVASYSVFPVDIICDGYISETAMSMTTMTHPDWRGKGLFQKLATELYAHAVEKQIAAVWGFPNANSHSTFNSKLLWSDIYEIPTLTLELQRIKASQLLPTVKVHRDDNFLLQYPALPKDGLIRVNRSRNYLIWRYANNPVSRYSNYIICREGVVTSYLVTKAYGDAVDLVDLQAANPEEARALLLHVTMESISNGFVKLNCWAPPHHFVHAVLERIGFTNNAPVTYFGGRTLIPSRVPAEWLDYRKWYIQMGDSDVY
jgi:hypothetical protein